jgi:pyrimidine-specific ribonucleoside hydrolase
VTDATRIPVILDCDPGHDDALAITLALARPELLVLGITTVGGNAPLVATTRNALRILALLGRTEVPVAAGGHRRARRGAGLGWWLRGRATAAGEDQPVRISRRA